MNNSDIDQNAWSKKQSLKKCRLGDVLDIRRGTNLSGKFYAENGSKIRLTLGNFDYPSGGFQENTSKKDIYFSGEVNPEFILKKDDIITPLTEQVAGLLGETAIIPVDDLYIQSGDIGLVVPDESVLDKSFAPYLVSSPAIKKQLRAAAQQTKIRHTSPDGIKNCYAWIPSLHYQHIAGKLLSALDAKIETNKKIISELEDLAKTIYDYWFLQFEFPNESGKPYRSSGGEMVWSEKLKREIPKGWEVGNLYDIAQFINGLACQKFRPKNSEPFLPVIKIREMHEGITDNTEHVKLDIPKDNVVKNGDILFSWSASLEVSRWYGPRCGLNQHIFKVVPLAGYTPSYVFQQLKAYVRNFAQMAETRKTTMGHITSDHLKQSKILLPSQSTINLFSKLIDPLELKIEYLNHETQQLTSLRDFLLPLLMNGQASIRETCDTASADCVS